MLTLIHVSGAILLMSIGFVLGASWCGLFRDDRDEDEEA